MFYNTHDLLIILSLSLGISFYIYHLTAILSFRKYVNNRNSLFYVLLSLCIIFSISTSLIFFSFDLNESLKKLGFTLIYFLGFLSTFFYATLLENLFNLQSIVTTFFKRIFLFFTFIYLTVLLIDLSFGSHILLENTNLKYYNYFLSKASDGYLPSKLAKYLISIGGSFIMAYVIYTLVKFKDLLKKEKLIAVGLFLTLVTILNDILIGSDKFYYLFPIAYLGFSFEIYRIYQYFFSKRIDILLAKEIQYHEVINNSELSFINQSNTHDICSIRNHLNKESLDPVFKNIILQKIDAIIKQLEPVPIGFKTNENLLKTVEQIITMEVPKKYKPLFKINIPKNIFLNLNKISLGVALKQLILNTLDNLKATNSNKSKTISLNYYPNKTLLYTDPYGKIDLSIRDKIFSRNVSSKGKGRGAGMSICRDALFSTEASICLIESENSVVFEISFY